MFCRSPQSNQEYVTKTYNKKYDCCKIFLNPLTPMSDQDRISPYNINQIRDETKEKYQFGDN